MTTKPPTAAEIEAMQQRHEMDSHPPHPDNAGDRDVVTAFREAHADRATLLAALDAAKESSGWWGKHCAIAHRECQVLRKALDEKGKLLERCVPTLKSRQAALAAYINDPAINPEFKRLDTLLREIKGE